jgi:nitronate monooxygenase
VFSFDGPAIPLVAAPMAGGPSTPRLVAAAGSVGGFGFLASGYLSVDAVRAQLIETRALTDGPFGVNLFVPAVDPRTEVAPAVREYRARLQGEAERYGVELPDPDPRDDDGYPQKLELLLAEPVAVVSFTFGLPSVETVNRLHDVGTHVAATVTDRAEALAARAVGVDSLVVQGVGAGGHRGTHFATKIPDATPLETLVSSLHGELGLPIVACGGVAGPQDVRRLLEAGASAVAVGTLLIRTPESGASQAHKDSFVDGTGGGETRVTRAFSGRLARAVVNRFLLEHDAEAPPFYPEVNQLARPLRAAAAAIGDADGLSLWAGTGFASARDVGAAQVLAELAPA